MVTIRKYYPKDLETVRRISLKASTHPDKTGDDLTYHYCLYTDYYITMQTDTSFVAVDDKDNVIGYLLCAKNCHEYVKTMKEVMIVQLHNEALEKRALQEMSVYEKFPGYDAHLHINIDPDYQHAGIGSMLMDELKKDLKSKGINGIMLGVASKNVNAIKFYEKNGFETIFSHPYAHVMGYRFAD